MKRKRFNEAQIIGVSAGSGGRGQETGSLPEIWNHRADLLQPVYQLILFMR